MTKGQYLREVRDVKSSELVSLDANNSKPRQRPRMGHLLESVQLRFTLLLEQGTRRGRSGRSVSLQSLVGKTLRDWQDRNVTIWRDYHAGTMNGGSEHLNGCSQWVRVEFQTMIRSDAGNRILTLLCKRRFRWICLR